MRGWVLPAVAGAFGTGILAFGERTEAAGAVLMLVAGAALLVAAAVAGIRRAARSRAVLEAAGLIAADAVPPGPAGARERVLAAAGIPGEPGGPRAPEPGGRLWARLGALLMGFVLLGGGWAAVRRAAAPDLGALAGEYVRFAGTAASDLRRSDFGWGFEADLEGVVSGDRAVSGDLRLWVSGSDPPGASIEAGQPVSGAGIVEGLDRGASGFHDYLAARGVAGILQTTKVRVLGPPANPAMRLANAARGVLRRGAFRSLPDREAALLLGLAIGDTSAMDPEVDRDFRASGLSHLLAVSGSNVALFLAPVLALTGLWGARPAGRFVVGLGAVAFFALLTRWEPSVLRASVMAGLALAGLLAGRPRSTAPLLGGAVLALLVADPGLARSVGFQLSVSATAGLAALASPLASRLGRVPRPVALALSATVAAQAAVTPLLLLHFGVVPTVTVLANLLAFPLVAPALFLGIAASGAALLWEPAGSVVGRTAGVPLGLLVSVADRTARLPLPALTGGGVLPVALAGMVAVGAWRLRRGRRPVVALAAVLALAALAWSAAPRAGPPSELTVTFFDVGQGDAAVVRAPDGATLLIDAGPDEDLVAARLAALGVRRIDLAVATHSHADHVEGFPTVLARFPVALLVEPGCPSDSPSYRRFVEAVSSEGVPVRHPLEGGRIDVGRLVVEVLGPEACSPGGTEPNDESLVLRIRYGQAEVLFTGDAERPAQQDLLDDDDPLAADVLKVPHHGGDTSLDEFFSAVGAEVAVVSTGPNDYGHPNAGVLERLRATGAVVLRTDLEGDITVRFAGDDVLVESARG